MTNCKIVTTIHLEHDDQITELENCMHVNLKIDDKMINKNSLLQKISPNLNVFPWWGCFVIF